MLLQKLSAYAQKLDRTPTLYAEGPLHYIIDLDQNGRCLSPKPVDLSDQSSPRTKRGQRRLLPQVQRSSNIRPLLLASPADYTLGLPRRETHTARAQKAHTAYVALVHHCAESTGEPDVSAVLNFLNNEPLAQLDIDDAFDRDGTITFRIAERLVIDIPAVQNFWASINQADGATTQCMVCGNYRPTLKRLQLKVKGIPGGQSSGTTIISANSDAFESYGLKNSQIAPTCADCAEQFTKGLNHLLASENNRFRSNQSVVVFWTNEDVDFDALNMIADPDPKTVQAMLQSVRSGRPTDIDETEFYAVSLTAATSRTVVRDWLNTTIGNVKQNLTTWFQNQRTAPDFDGTEHYYGVIAMASSTVRDIRELPASTTHALFNSAFAGTPLPEYILRQAVKRCHVERRVTRPRAALIKLAMLSRNPDHEENYMVQLDTDNTHPGYLCGRLMCELEALQRRAIGRNINSTVTDRYYGSASTAPQSAFPFLLRNAKHHISKLRRGTSRERAAATAINIRIDEILSKLEVIPKIMGLDQQCRFALGYHHQRSANYRQIAERAAANQAASETELNTQPDQAENPQE